MRHKKENVNILRKWWFWLIIVILLIIAITLIISSLCENRDNNSQKVEINENSNNEIKSVGINKTPYNKMNNYDGAYKFSIEDKLDNGNLFWAKGIIVFDDGNCNVKYIHNPTTTTTKEYSLNGYCGTPVNNTAFHFMTLTRSKEINDVYQCEKNENNLICKLKSGFNFAGCTKEELILEYIGDSNDIDSLYNDFKSELKKEEEDRKEIEAKKEEETFKNECTTLTYEGLARNPDNIKGNKVKLTGKVIQVIASSGVTNLRINITKSSYGYYSDTIYITYKPIAGEDRILEDDIVTIWGTAEGNYSYTSVMGVTVTLPKINAKYIKIN